MAIKKQDRRGDGRFVKDTTGASKAPQARPVTPHARVTRPAGPATSTGPIVTVPVELRHAPLAAGEAQRFSAAMQSALRTPTTPADRMALAAERRIVENRFGTIDWAA